MVCKNAVNNLVVFAIFLCKIRADLVMRAFNLVVNCLADVVQQTCTLRKLNVNAEFRCHKSGKVRNFD